ncbi:hypothetical protein Pst134EA_004742 [Puccinia striiformis f. sp. tritici]|uniref:hypothetical protein n=1 Tax=Puccinia striiformis f. sp. tritici TaxID=168172 RepID=UPI00200731B3|nr:hypothetical protein Pst134EA_004742 [Puccinia striiformis f. sp. tritici]KAH9470824.1 hypothetical protein Pst134EA_004742 [Puccinia striiformis f. sp. tritici]
MLLLLFESVKSRHTLMGITLARFYSISQIDVKQLMFFLLSFTRGVRTVIVPTDQAFFCRRNWKRKTRRWRSLIFQFDYKVTIMKIEISGIGHISTSSHDVVTYGVRMELTEEAHSVISKLLAKMELSSANNSPSKTCAPAWPGSKCAGFGRNRLCGSRTQSFWMSFINHLFCLIARSSVASAILYT